MVDFNLDVTKRMTRNRPLIGLDAIIMLCSSNVRNEAFKPFCSMSLSYQYNTYSAILYVGIGGHE